MAKSAVDVPAGFGWSYLHTYSFAHVHFTIIILQKIESNDLTMTLTTRLATYITLYDLKAQYISWDSVIFYDELYSENLYPAVHRCKM